MALHINNESSQSLTRLDKTALPATGAEPVGGGAVFQKMLRLIEANDFASAIDLLRGGGHSAAIRNALGVCLIRSGRAKDAIPAYRNLVLAPGGTWERAEVPDSYKRNFAVALLMVGQPAGCLEVLRSTSDPNHAKCAEIRNAIKEWEQSLSFLRRWDWKLGQVVPPNCVIELNFVPGEFEHQLLEASSPKRSTTGKSARGQS